MARQPTGLTRRAWLGLLLAPSALARAAAPAASAPPGARLRGQARMRWLGMPIYDIRLWAGETFDPARFAQQPFALELEYALSLSGARIAQRSMDEIVRLQPLTDARRERWLEALQAACPDVQRGDTLAGRNRPGAGVDFFHNGRPTTRIDDAEFSAAFFAIWLSPRTSEPELRQSLLGPLA